MHDAMRNSCAQAEVVMSTWRNTDARAVFSVAEQLWSQLDTPKSLGLALLLRNNQIREILSETFEPSRYLERDTQLAGDDYQAIAFLKKLRIDDVVPASERERESWKKFLAAEDVCRQTNARFRARWHGVFSTPAVESILHSAQRKIARWLGNLDAKSWALRCRFGPGADNLSQGPRVSSYHKLSSLSATAGFVEGAMRLAQDHPSWSRYLGGIPLPDDCGPSKPLSCVSVPGNQITFVPKTALIDRSIAIEPRMNIFAQLGLGALLRSRLKRVGMDLDNQEPSRVLARLGSINGTVATLDLSMASDTLALEVVRDLVPLPWLTAMEWVRSPEGIYQTADGAKHRVVYEKFSSMGNGYTFELESMIFYALALSCVEFTGGVTELVKVFGDDIAIPTGSVDLLEEVLAYCGFVVNTDKSFSSGLFRESCGADYFNGVNVRPYFQKEDLDRVESLYRMANGIRRAACRRNLGFGYDGRYKRAWTAVVQRVPSSLRLIRGPFRLSTKPSGFDVECDDGYLASELDEGMSSPWVRKAPGGLQGWYFSRFDPRGAFEVSKEHERVYLYALYTSRDGCGGVAHKAAPNGAPFIQLRGSSSRRLTRRAYALEWRSFGPWVTPETLAATV